MSLSAYPALTVYGWCLIPSARAFDAYLLASCEHWETVRHTQLDVLERSRV